VGCFHEFRRPSNVSIIFHYLLLLLPPNSRIDQVLLHIADSKVHWGSCVDDVVEPNLLGFENIIEGTRSGDVGNVDKGDLSFPFRMKLEDCFGL
jgi:hypothetical protein